MTRNAIAYFSGLCAALAAMAILPGYAAAKTPKLVHSVCGCHPTHLPAATLTRERGVTVYRAAPRPWRHNARPEQTAVHIPRHKPRLRHNYLEVDTRSRGEWGPVNAVYQKF